MLIYVTNNEKYLQELSGRKMKKTDNMGMSPPSLPILGAVPLWCTIFYLMGNNLKNSVDIIRTLFTSICSNICKKPAYNVTRYKKLLGCERHGASPFGRALALKRLRSGDPVLC